MYDRLFSDTFDRTGASDNVIRPCVSGSDANDNRVFFRLYGEEKEHAAALILFDVSSMRFAKSRFLSVRTPRSETRDFHRCV